MSEDAERTQRCIARYLELGLAPLPSRDDEKVPAMRRFAHHFDGEPLPEDVVQGWSWTNVQLITGVRSYGPTKLLVVDCDGEEATGRWATIQKKFRHVASSTWISYSGSGTGTHHYYRLPVNLSRCPGGIIWGLWDTFGDDGTGKWEKHKEVRVLGDGGLAIAPPSRHVDTKNRYAFDPARNPNRIADLEIAPLWLIQMPRLQKPRLVQPPRAPPKIMKMIPGRRYTRGDVLDAIRDKLSVARDWGLVTRGEVSRDHWIVCYVPRREIPWESRPSGSFNVRDGVVIDHKDKSVMSFLDVAVHLGIYLDWRDALNDLGQRFLGIPLQK